MMTKLRILYVAYPMVRLSADSAGGAEQMLHVVEREMRLRGHHTTVAACDGSRVAGELCATGPAPVEADRFAQRNAEHNVRVVKVVIARERAGQEFDLVHDQSGTFWPKAARLGVPVLATLHLPRSFYPA